jgi:hypothetical protein
MFTHVKFESALVGLVCIAVSCMNGRASAVTAEVARKCVALTAKAYPPQVPGNPAAGLAKGTVQSKRDYFNKCVANGGKMDDDAPEHPPLPPSRGAASVPQRDRSAGLGLRPFAKLRIDETGGRWRGEAVPGWGRLGSGRGCKSHGRGGGAASIAGLPRNRNVTVTESYSLTVAESSYGA